MTSESSLTAGSESTEGKEKFGKNVRVRSRWFRHAQKASGNVGSGQHFSSSLLSPEGLAESEELGRQLGEPLKDGVLIGHSEQKRTKETAVETVAGYTMNQRVMPLHFPVGHEELLFPEPQPYAQLYNDKWTERKRLLMVEQGLIDSDADLKEMGRVFDALSSGEQAHIAETAEEPVISEWLDDPESDLAQAYSAEYAAARSAVLLRHDLHVPETIRSGEEYDMMRFTHKTVTEALLMRIIRFEDGSKPEKLSDIKGALGLNDGFEFDIQTDEKGERMVTFTMYRVDRSGDEPRYVTQEYDVNLEELERLADLGIQLSKERRENS